MFIRALFGPETVVILSIIKLTWCKKVSLRNTLPARYLTAKMQWVWLPGYTFSTFTTTFLNVHCNDITTVKCISVQCSTVQCNTILHITLQYSKFPRGQVARSSMTSMTSLLRRLPRGGRDRHRRRKGEQEKVRATRDRMGDHGRTAVATGDSNWKSMGEGKISCRQLSLLYGPRPRKDRRLCLLRPGGWGSSGCSQMQWSLHGNTEMQCSLCGEA